MNAESKRRGVKWLAGVIFAAVAWIITVTVGILDISKDSRVAQACQSAGLGDFCVSGLQDSPSPPPPPQDTSVIVSLTGRSAMDRDWASILNSGIATEVIKLPGSVSGYKIIGQVKGAEVTSSGDVRFDIEWQLSKGLVQRSCEPIPIRFNGQMESLSVSRVLKRMQPALLESAKYGDVRC